MNAQIPVRSNRGLGFWSISLLCATLLFTTLNSFAAETVLLHSGSVWKYRNTSTAPFETWKNPSFNDSEWLSGAAQLGYGDGDEATVTEGATLSPKPISAYFRSQFVIGGDKPAKLLLRLKRDDGAIVYLNGVPVLRSNMPDGAITSTTLASSTIGPEAEETFHVFTISSTYVQTGTNSIAVEVHQSAIASSDLSFDLELIGSDESGPELPLVSVEAAQALTSEPVPTALIAPGRFLFRRTGDLSQRLTVYVFFGGTATAGSDYTALTSPIVFEEGRSEVALNVVPLSDELVEGEETVVCEISLPPTASLPTYNADPNKRRAVVTIADEDRLAPSTVQLVKPTEGASFSAGTTIQLEAVATNPRGYITRVEFLDGDHIIGVSEIAFVTAPTNGTPIHHTFSWTGALAGEHALRARASVSGALVASAPVHISVIGTERPVVSIVASRPETSEPSPIAKFASGLFTLRRTGPTNEALTVFVAIAGTASNGSDYLTLSNTVRFAAGQRERGLEVVALDDNLIEGDETVVAELYIPPFASPLPDPYIIDSTLRRAVVTIHDEDRPAARIQITQPLDGQHFGIGSNVVIQARAIDPIGAITRVEFYDGTNKIGVSEITFVQAPAPGTPILHEFVWLHPSIGSHTIRARGVTANGAAVISQEVHISVQIFEYAVPQVSLRYLPDLTDRPTPNADYAPGWFEISRRGMTNEPLEVLYRVADASVPELHLATPDVDYQRLPGSAVIPAGSTNVLIAVQAIDDTLVEGPEYVSISLAAAPPNANGVPRYMIDDDHKTASLQIYDNDQGDQVVLAVEVRDAIASEPGIITVVDDGIITIKRVGGPSNVSLNAYYSVSGTASNGVDYTKLTGTLELPAGVLSRDIHIHALMDNVAEGDETVTLTLTPPVCAAIIPPPPGCYLIDNPASGTVIIKNFGGGENRAPVARIAHPLKGAVFTIGQTIEIVAEASDADGSIVKLQIMADGAPLGSSETNRLVIRWENADLGEHVLTALATDNLGKTGLSENVSIMIRERNATAFVFRHLPDTYTPGSSLRVELRAEPPAGSRAYAAEDHPPVGWVVSEISNDGAFDPATGKVKFGPFTDAVARTLSYRVTPPSNSTGRQEFSGVGSVDGASYPIGGDRIISQSPTQHPADTNADFQIVINELTAYAAAWKGGETWSNGPVPIPMSFVTRAGFIWKKGEAYSFNAAFAAPLCWTPVNASTSSDAMMAASLAPDGETVRIGEETARPGLTAQIQLNITPPTATSSYAVEEKVPHGWTVTDISHEGTFDTETGIIRWGLFLDNSARSLHYTVTPPANVAEIGRLIGRVSFDGNIRELTGRERVTSVDGTKLPRLENVTRDGDGIHITLGGETGQVGVLQRSTDLVHWEDVKTIYLPDGALEFLDDSATLGGHNYYRLQVR